MTEPRTERQLYRKLPTGDVQNPRRNETKTMQRGVEISRIIKIDRGQIQLPGEKRGVRIRSWEYGYW